MTSITNTGAATPPESTPPPPGASKGEVSHGQSGPLSSAEVDHIVVALEAQKLTDGPERSETSTRRTVTFGATTTKEYEIDEPEEDASHLNSTSALLKHRSRLEIGTDSHHETEKASGSELFEAIKPHLDEAIMKAWQPIQAKFDAEIASIRETISKSDESIKRTDESIKRTDKALARSNEVLDRARQIRLRLQARKQQRSRLDSDGGTP
ncbi:MAG TPA: hypothetical protein VF169_09935 [Albitalea sp.]|uniref:hypothetical protein n=1 Tax=Piscinibacter sp. TaxID=1903157 RepID=UPI002ED1C79A